MALICWRHRSKVERGHIGTLRSALLLAVLLVQAHVHGGLGHGQRPGLRSADTARNVHVRRSSSFHSRYKGISGLMVKHHDYVSVGCGFETRHKLCILDSKILFRSKVELLDLSAIAPMH